MGGGVDEGAKALLWGKLLPGKRQENCGGVLNRVHHPRAEAVWRRLHLVLCESRPLTARSRPAGRERGGG